MLREGSRAVQINTGTDPDTDSGDPKTYGSGTLNVTEEKLKEQEQSHPGEERKNLDMIEDVGPIGGGVFTVATVEDPCPRVPPNLPLNQL